MHIALLGPAYPYRGGIASFGERLALALMHEAQATVSLHTFSLQYPNFLFPGTTQYALNEPPPQQLHISRSINSINPLSWWRLGRQLQQQAPQLVVSQFWLPFMAPALGSIQALARRNRRTRAVGIMHNVLPHEPRPLDHTLTRYFVGQCDGFVGMSHSVLNDLSVFTNNPHRLFVPHPIYDNFGEPIPKQLARQQLGIDPNDKIILFFGLIRHYKGLDLLLQALADARLQQRRVKLLIAGEYYEAAEPYQALIAQHQLHERTLLHTRFIPNNEVKNYFSAADIVVQPYRHATQSGISQMAYHFGRPMLVTNVGGLPEIVPNGEVGYVVSATPSAIADALVDFYDHQREATFAQQVNAQKHRFSWSAMAQAIVSLA